MKCLRETDSEVITQEVCETTAINDACVVELYTTHYSNRCWAAVTFVCKHMKKLSNLKLMMGLFGHCPSEILGLLLRKRCLNELEIHNLSRFVIFTDRIDVLSNVFSALMELNCTLDHKHTKLTSLILRRSAITTEAGLPVVCKFFENGHASQLEQLNLDCNEIYLHQITKLCEVLHTRHCPNLTYLNLRHNLIGNKGAKVLFFTLTKGLCKLYRLAVELCDFTNKCIPTLVKALQDERCQLTDLSLGFNHIGDRGACMLFEDALTNEHCKLTALNLERCSLTDQSIPCLCKALQDERCQLTDLSLEGNAIGDESACMLFEGALTNEHCKLTELNLDECSLTDQCIPSLCKALQDERCQLTVLSLENNAIGDKGVGTLFEDALMQEHCKLTELQLNGCSLTDQCIPSLCEALKDGQCILTKLSLRDNNFTENGKKLLRDITNYKSCEARGLQIASCILGYGAAKLFKKSLTP
jgi:hypothetical protein